MGDDIQGDTLSANSVTAVSSNLSAGNTVQFDAGNDITVEGSNIAAGMDISLDAVNDVSIVSAEETASHLDSAGNPKYHIPPDATPSGELMKTLDPRKKGGTLAELGYPNGIPVKVIRTKGVGG